MEGKGKPKERNPTFKEDKHKPKFNTVIEDHNSKEDHNNKVSNLGEFGELRSNSLIKELNENTPIECNYYSKEEFNATFENNKGLSFFHLNIASLAKHIDNLRCLLNELKSNFKVLAITETRITSTTFNLHNFEIPGYSFISNKTDSSAGGTALYISSSLNFNVRNDLSDISYLKNLLESSFIEIENLKQTNIIVGSIYKHPGLSISEFVNDYLSPLLHKVSKENKRIILLGDFNINLLEYDLNNNVKSFIDTLLSNFVMPTISLPTRITTHSETLIDNIIVSHHNGKLFTGNLIAGISDHLPQFLIFDEPIHENKVLSTERWYKDWEAFDYQNFNTDLHNTDWENILEIESNNPNVSFENFFNTLNKLIELHLPMKKLTKKQIRSQHKPWITKGIKRSIKNRDWIYKKFIKEKDPTIKSIIYNRFKFYRNNIVKLIRKAKINHFKNFFNNNMRDSKNIWKGINQLITSKASTNSTKISLKINNTTENNPAILANEFNNFFTSVAENVRKNIPPTNSNFEEFLQFRSQHSFFLKPVSTEEVEKQISSLDTKKATGPYSIPTKILKFASKKISEILTIIFNISFRKGIYIDLLKTAKVIPIFKNKGSSLEISNYRPISLLSNIDKILEKLIHCRMTNYLEKNNIIFNQQFGFRKNSSTLHALATITNKIYKSFENDEITCGIFLDLQKAFDTVDHKILIKKLDHYGFRGITNDLLKSYLSGRNQFVSISGSESLKKNIKYGVPQGSVLGPLLFIIYINDLANAINYSETFIFADDTAILYSDKSPKRIKKRVNIDLKFILKWLKANKISLNVKKTEMVLFKQSRKFINYTIKIKLDGKRLIPVSNINYLGVTLNENMSWMSHTEGLANKLRISNGILCKLRHFMPRNLLRMVYFSIFNSHLSYALQIWGQCLSSQSRIIKLQKCAVRIMTFSDYNAPTTLLFNQLRIKSVDNLVFIQNIKLTHQTLNKISPSAIQNALQLSYVSNRYTTRATTNKLLRPLKMRTTKFGIYSLNNQLINHWNILQNHFKEFDLSALSLSRVTKLTEKFISKTK